MSLHKTKVHCKYQLLDNMRGVQKNYTFRNMSSSRAHGKRTITSFEEFLKRTFTTSCLIKFLPGDKTWSMGGWEAHTIEQNYYLYIKNCPRREKTIYTWMSRGNPWIRLLRSARHNPSSDWPKIWFIWLADSVTLDKAWNKIDIRQWSGVDRRLYEVIRRRRK